MLYRRTHKGQGLAEKQKAWFPHPSILHRCVSGAQCGSAFQCRDSRLLYSMFVSYKHREQLYRRSNTHDVGARQSGLECQLFIKVARKINCPTPGVSGAHRKCFFFLGEKSHWFHREPFRIESLMPGRVDPSSWYLAELLDHFRTVMPPMPSREVSLRNGGIQ